MPSWQRYQRGGGLYDEYCSLCGLPFYSPGDEIKESNQNSNNSSESTISLDVDTEWLETAIGYCLKTRKRLPLKEYDGYGNMETEDGDEFGLGNTAGEVDHVDDMDHYGYAFHKDCVDTYESTGMKITVENAEDTNNRCASDKYHDQFFQWAKAYKKEGDDYFESPRTSRSTRNRVLRCAVVRNIPSGSTNVISYEDIEDGDKMVNFQGEYDYGRYYKRSTFNAMPRKINPITSQPLRKRNVADYTARVVPTRPSRSRSSSPGSRRSRSRSRGGGMRKRSTRRRQQRR